MSGITAEMLHRAADMVGAQDDPEGLTLGFDEGALVEFVHGSEWSDDGSGATIKLDPLSLALGLSIGAVAASIEASA